MIVVMELLALIAAVVVAVAGVASNSGSIQPLSDNFVIPGQRLNGLSTRQPASYGIAVRLVVLLGPGNPETPTRACRGPDPGHLRDQAAGLGKRGNPGGRAGQGQGASRPGAVREIMGNSPGRHQNERS
jgi:hypothetical protein